MQKDHHAPGKLDYTITSVQRALRILELFMPDNRGLTQNEISLMTGFNKSTVLRMVFTLCDEGFLRMEAETKKYKIGTKAMQIGLAALDSLSLAKVADPILHNLSNETGFVTHLGILEGDSVVVIAKTFPNDQPFSTRLQSTVGGILPIYCTGIGLLFLSQEPEENARKILEKCNLIAYTRTTETNIERIMARLAEIRRDKWMLNNGEHDDGIVSVCYPIFDHTRKMVAGMSLGGIREVVFQQNVEALKEKAKRAALMISRDLGYYR